MRKTFTVQCKAQHFFRALIQLCVGFIAKAYNSSIAQLLQLFRTSLPAAMFLLSSNGVMQAKHVWLANWFLIVR